MWCFVYYRLYKTPVSPMISLRLYTRRQEAFVKSAFWTNVLPLCWPIDTFFFLISQPHLTQPQLAHHKHETEVASPQYTLHWHLQHLIPQLQCLCLDRGGRNRSACFPTLRRGTENVSWRQRKGSAHLYLHWQIPLRTTGPQPSPCLGNSGTRALGNAEPEHPRERTPGGIGASIGEGTSAVLSSADRAMLLSQTGNTKNVCIPYPLDNAGRDEHTS